MINEKMILKDLKLVNFNRVVKDLEDMYDVDDLEIRFWSDEECRDLGICYTHISYASNIKDLIIEARNLVDKLNYASVEIADQNDKLLYFYDDEDEIIVY